MPQTTETERQALSVGEVAAKLGIHELTVRRRIARGELESFKLGGRRLIPRRVIDALLSGDQPQGEAVSGGT